jgi:O-antigen/teichoic acid export membrane protein
MYVLNISDRFILRFFYSEYVVGLYVPNYSIASATFLMIAYGLSRGFYPRLLGAWAKDAKDEAGRILSASIKTYILLGLPAATGMFLLSKDIGQIIIAKEYEAGYPVIGIVAFGMFFLNLADYMNKEWELSKNTKPIFINSLIAAAANLSLNFASIIYFLMSGIRRKKILEIIVEKKDFISIIFANVVMCICVIISSVLPIQGYILIISKGMIGVISYFATWLAIRKILW